jgi:outer membrane protein assembly factor BamB
MCRLGVSIAIALVVVAGGQRALAAENWPEWRGPLGTGVAAAGDYPVEFSAEKNVAWKTELPGLGRSTPAVWGDKIFLTCGIDGQDGVVCYGMDGRERWRKTLGPERPGKHPNGTGSNPSPVTDGQHLVVYYKSGTLACLDLAGNVLWQVNLQDRYGKDTLWWDLGTSPVLTDGCVVVAVMHSGDSYLVAFDLSSGEVRWKQPRQYDCAVESDQSYATPHVTRLDGKEVIITWGADHLTGHDAATGELLWESGGFNPDNTQAWRTIASAAVGNGVAIVPFGRGKFVAGVRLGGHGDVTQSNRLWDKQGFGSDVPTAAVRDGKAYLLTDRGSIFCLEVESGDELWSANLPRNRHKYYASPVLAGDVLYAAREDGMVFVGRVGDNAFELLAENPMGEQIFATPVPIRDGLLIRGGEHLFRIASQDRAE